MANSSWDHLPYSTGHTGDPVPTPLASDPTLAPQAPCPSPPTPVHSPLLGEHPPERLAATPTPPGGRVGRVLARGDPEAAGPQDTKPPKKRGPEHLSVQPQNTFFLDYLNTIHIKKLSKNSFFSVEVKSIQLQGIISNCAIQGHLVHPNSSFKAFPPPPKETPYLQAIIPHSTPTPAATDPPPVSVDLPSLDISHKRTHSLFALLGPASLHSASGFQGSPTLHSVPHSFLWLHSIPLWAQTPVYLPVHCWWTFELFPPSGCSCYYEHGYTIPKCIDI